MKIKIPEQFQFLFKPKPFKIAFGGRGGAKTVSFAKALLFLAQREKKRVLCLREYMNSIDESVHSALEDEVSILKMKSHYTVYRNRIDGRNGSVFRYAALSRNIDSIKSKHKFDIAWVEEAETVSEASLDYLIPTIREAGAEIWISFNPKEEFGAVYQLIKPFLDPIRTYGYYEDDTYYIVKTNLSDNPFASQLLIDNAARMEKENPKKWLHIYGGEVYSDYRESIIQPEWVDAAIDAHIKLGFEPAGVKSLGFDPADTGADEKAVILRHGVVITHGKRWMEGEFPDALDIAFTYAYDLRAEYIVYDGDGLGVGVKVGLAQRLEGKNIIAVSYRGNDSVDNPYLIYADDKTNKDTFLNKRAQYYWMLRDRFEATYNAVTKKLYTNPLKLISISSEIKYLDVLKSQLIQIKRAYGQRSLIQIMSKKDMRKLGIKSPGMTDALVMCFANPVPTPKTIKLQYATEFKN